jgi:hypothetical protein
MFGLIAALVLSLLAPTSQAQSVPDVPIAIVGGTLLDLSTAGKSQADIRDAVLLIEGERIVAVGERGTVGIPDGARIIDASGMYVLPGLIDGFGAIDNQSYADAYLYMGVTSVVTLSGMRRGPLFEQADPAPRMFKLMGIAPHPRSTEEILTQIDEAAAQGYRIVLLMYGVTPEQLRLAIRRAHELGMTVIGELGSTSYAEAIETDIDAFVHTIRYSLDLVPPDLAQAIAADHHGLQSRQTLIDYQQFFIDLEADDPRLSKHTALLAASGKPLIPTLALQYLPLPFSTNPWNEPIASILDAGDIHMPANRATGEHDVPAEAAARWERLATKLFMVDSVYCAAGAQYLAGSGTDLLGTMPGISIHTELELLVRLGLSHREAIAAATANFAEFFGWQDVGLLERGRYADILVLAGNPLEDLRNLKRIELLMKGGEVVDRDSLIDGHTVESRVDRAL